MTAVFERCEIVEFRTATDGVGYACTTSAAQHCDDCGASLCIQHAAKCDRCIRIFCSGCLSFHVDEFHSKPAVSVSPDISHKRSA